MGIDNKNFWIGTIVVTLLLAVSLINFGLRLDNDGVLDNNSVAYLSDLNDNYEDNGLADGVNDTQFNNQDSNTNPFVDAIQDVPGISDFLGVANLFISVTTGVWDFLKTLYNIPSFLIEGLGIPTGAFKQQLNILGTLIGIGILITLLVMVK